MAVIYQHKQSKARRTFGGRIARLERSPDWERVEDNEPQPLVVVVDGSDEAGVVQVADGDAGDTSSDGEEGDTSSDDAGDTSSDGEEGDTSSDDAGDTSSDGDAGDTSSDGEEGDTSSDDAGDTSSDDAGDTSSDDAAAVGVAWDTSSGDTVADDAEGVYPRHKGGGNYELSDGSTVKGKDAATVAEAALGS